MLRSTFSLPSSIPVCSPVCLFAAWFPFVKSMTAHTLPHSTLKRGPRLVYTLIHTNLPHLCYIFSTQCFLLCCIPFSHMYCLATQLQLFPAANARLRCFRKCFFYALAWVFCVYVGFTKDKCSSLLLLLTSSVWTWTCVTDKYEINSDAIIADQLQLQALHTAVHKFCAQACMSLHLCGFRAGKVNIQR